MSNSISNEYYGKPNLAPNLNNMFDAVQQGYQMGRDFANSVIQDQSRRYGPDPGNQGFNHPDILNQLGSPSRGYYSNQPRPTYRVPELDRYGWGPGRCGTYKGESLSRYPGIWMETYGSGVRL